MPKSLSFEQVAKAADHLSLEEQETLADLLRKRSAAARRRQIAKEARNADREHRAGSAKASSVDRLMAEIRR